MYTIFYYLLIKITHTSHKIHSLIMQGKDTSTIDLYDTSYAKKCIVYHMSIFHSSTCLYWKFHDIIIEEEIAVNYLQTCQFQCVVFTFDAT
jgi:hypothetical protein